MGSIPGSGRSPGGGNGNPLQYSCLENSMDRGAWWLQSMGSLNNNNHLWLRIHLLMQGDAVDSGLSPGLGRCPGEGNGNPLQYPCLENSMDRGAWWATVHGVTKSWTRLTVQFSHSVVSDSLQPMDCSPPGSSVHGIFQARKLEWFAIFSSRGSSQPGD